MRIGVHYLGDGTCEFAVWAPLRTTVDLLILSSGSETVYPMKKDDRGYWHSTVDGVSEGTQYLYRLDGDIKRPDPASQFQPDGVHGPSQIIDHTSFTWSEQSYKPRVLQEMIIYELHVGTFTDQGTFEDIITRIDELKDIGINTIEIMPVSQFPGERNWGYDGTYPFAVQNSYGGSEGLKKLVAACHDKDVSVILDVVYNHLGHEGNYLWDYGPYFTEKYKTPWGSGINFDGAYSNEVRNYFIENALYWFGEYHIDGLRLDAVHGIYDMSARPFLKQLAECVEVFSQKQKRNFLLIAESDLNDSKVITPRSQGGYGHDGQWCDDFHHALHTVLTGENCGYYKDFGDLTHLEKSFQEGYVYSGQYSAFRKRDHGNSSLERSAEQFVVFSQNHDQVGNRMNGQRLSSLVSYEALKLAAGTVLLSPYIPLLFMGQEYAENNPFMYFVSYGDKAMIDGVRKGRIEEFKEFHTGEAIHDPQNEEIFLRSKLDWDKRSHSHHAVMLEFYKTLINLRKTVPALSHLDKKSCEIVSGNGANSIIMRRWHEKSEVLTFFNYEDKEVRFSLPDKESIYTKLCDSSDKKWNGLGTLLPDKIKGAEDLTVNPLSFIIFSIESVV